MSAPIAAQSEDWWYRLLETEFTGNDYIKLTLPWKQARMRRVASSIALAVKWTAEEKDKEMSEPTTTTTSEPRPVSALEQTLRNRAITPISIQGADAESWAYSVSADLVRERDTDLFRFLAAFETGQYIVPREATLRLRAILEGKTD